MSMAGKSERQIRTEVKADGFRGREAAKEAGRRAREEVNTRENGR